MTQIDLQIDIGWKIAQSFEQINVYGWTGGPILENGGCRVGGVSDSWNEQGVPPAFLVN